MNFFEVKLKEIVKETSDSYSYIFDIPEGYEFKAGQHTMWKTKDIKLDENDREIRIFSIASAPEDNFLMFTTRIADPHTSYKEYLKNQIKVGDSLLVAEAKGNFDLDRTCKKSFVIAGGIGITPVRSILKHWSENNDLDHDITVLYSDDRGEFAYKEAFAEISAKMPNLKLIYISDRDEFTNKTDEFAKKNLNDSEYLVAGSPMMNKIFKEKLMNLGVEEKNIKIDNFMGY